MIKDPVLVGLITDVYDITEDRVANQDEIMSFYVAAKYVNKELIYSATTNLEPKDVPTFLRFMADAIEGSMKTMEVDIGLGRHERN